MCWNQGCRWNSSKPSLDLHVKRLAGSLSRNFCASKLVWEKRREETHALDNLHACPAALFVGILGESQVVL